MQAQDGGSVGPSGNTLHYLPGGEHELSTTTNATPPAFDPGYDRPPSLISTASDCLSDTFSSYDSRRSTVSSVSSAATAQSQSQYQQQQSQSPRHSLTSSPCSSRSYDPQSQANSPQRPLTRSRENAKQLHAARQQKRAASQSLANDPAAEDKERDGHKNDRDPDDVTSRLRRRTGNARRLRKGTNPESRQTALAATEPGAPPHEKLLTKMAFAEQQHWITVQQKTFTKWLNTKIDVRGLEVKDLVKDLSDGVRLSLFCFLCPLLDPLHCYVCTRSLLTRSSPIGHPHPPVRMLVSGVSRSLCRQAKTQGATLRKCEPGLGLRQVEGDPDGEHGC